MNNLSFSTGSSRETLLSSSSNDYGLEIVVSPTELTIQMMMMMTKTKMTEKSPTKIRSHAAIATHKFCHQG